MIADSDSVVLEYVGSGVNTGVLVTPQGRIEPNGQHVVADFVDVWKFRDGMIIRGRSYVGGLMRRSVFTRSSLAAAVATRRRSA